MTTVWDAAKALQAIAGAGDPALAAAHDFAAICTRHGERDEANFWLAVADAIAWEINPQPLIAPEIGPDRKKRSASNPRWPQHRRLNLPERRSNALRFRRDLRELWERYRSKSEQPDDAKNEPDNNA